MKNDQIQEHTGSTAKVAEMSFLLSCIYEFCSTIASSRSESSTEMCSSLDRIVSKDDGNEDGRRV